MVAYNRPVFKAAAVQAAPVLRDEPVYIDLAATLDKACKLIAQAGGNGARLIVFPEGFLPTFPYWSVNVDQPYEWTRLWKEFVNNSVEVPSAETEALCRAAKEADAFVVMGINERDRAHGGRMYNATLFISPYDGVLGVHRKVNPTLGELLYHTRGDGGDNIKAIKTEVGTLGSLICGEHIQLPLVHNWIVQGVEINCALWPGSRKWSLNTEIQVMTRAVSLAGAMFSISACCCIPEELRPKKFYPNACLDRTGGSSIIDPMGDYVAGPVFDSETIVYGDIDMGKIAMSKSIHNVTGIYSRWDLFSLAVRQEPYQPLIPLEHYEQAAPEQDTGQMKQLEQKIAALEQQLKDMQQQLKQS